MDPKAGEQASDGGRGPRSKTRRRWLAGALAAGGVVAGGGVLFGLGWRRGTAAAGLRVLGESDRAIVAAMADAWFPGDEGLPAAETIDVVAHVDAYLASLPENLGKATRLLIRAIEWGALPGTLGFTRFSRQSREVRAELLDAWEESSIYARRMGFLSLKLAVGMAYFDDSNVRTAVGFVACPAPTTPVEEWL